MLADRVGLPSYVRVASDLPALQGQLVLFFQHEGNGAAEVIVIASTKEISRGRNTCEKVIQDRLHWSMTHERMRLEYAPLDHSIYTTSSEYRTYYDSSLISRVFMNQQYALTVTASSRP